MVVVIIATVWPTGLIDLRDHLDLSVGAVHGSRRAGHPRGTVPLDVVTARVGEQLAASARRQLQQALRLGAGTYSLVLEG